jgi:hypothetical protein
VAVAHGVCTSRGFRLGTNYLDKRLLLLLEVFGKNDTRPSSDEIRSIGVALREFLADLDAECTYNTDSGAYDLLFEREGLEKLAKTMEAGEVSAEGVRAIKIRDTPYTRFAENRRLSLRKPRTTVPIWIAMACAVELVFIAAVSAMIWYFST